MNLQGDLREFSLADLLRILDHGARTGRLTIETPVLHGELYWQGGRLIDARLDSLQGDEAIYPWLIWPEGKFQFTEGGETPAPTIHLAVADILAEGLQRQEAWTRISDLAPGWGPDSRVTWLGAADERLPLAADGASAHDLLTQAGGATVPLAQQMAALLADGRIRLEPTEAGALHRWFQRLTAEIYAGFSAISGFKLIAELDRHLQTAIDDQAWNLAWAGGKITDKIPFARTADEQLATYEAFLRELAGFIFPVYGQTLLRQATERAGEPSGGLARSLKQRWLAVDTVAARTDD
jgi:hypothetical protein